ncbi:MAG: glycosyl hydrolase-related protein [Kiritimatiellae bacterium]|nr:glycosyl hydrolase-related protein [Kiritimatiellia bacterium]MDD5519801.1 glycosyl hydrolase-related protein [Kiritimatiellia bacterium]
MNTQKIFIVTGIVALFLINAVTLDIAAGQSTELRPAAYVAPMSHLDLTFMGTVEECLSRGSKVFAGTLDLLEKQPDFHFFLEYVLFLEAYRTIHPEQAARLDEYIKKGRVELGAEWSGIYVNQEDEENLIRNVLYAKAYARERYKLELETLQLTDIPGVVPQLPQLCAGLGIRNLVLTRCAMPNALFWYESPGGARVLTWSSKGYNQAAGYGMHLDLATMHKKGLSEHLAGTITNGLPSLFYYGSDQWLSPPNLAPTVNIWNQENSKQRLMITTPTAYFRAMRATGVADKVPIMKGELPSTWPYLEPAHAHISRWDSVATRALDAAERLSTLAWLRANCPYPRAELDALWKSLLLARDHNYGGQGAGGGHPRKFAERRAVQHRAQVLTSAAIAVIAERVEVPRESIPIVVFNTLNWNRSDVVNAHVSSYSAAGSHQRDIIPPGPWDKVMVLRGPDSQPVPFQITAARRLGEFDFSFVARDVPALGYTSYTLEPVSNVEAVATGAKWDIGRPRVVQNIWFETDSPDLVLENDAVRVTIERATGLVKLTSLQGKAFELVNGLGLSGRQELPEVCRQPPLGLSVDDPAREKIESFVPASSEPVSMQADGPVVVSATVRGSVMGAPAELRYTLYRGLPWVDVEVRIDWDLRKFGRIELSYQVPLTNVCAAYGLPFGAGAFGTEQLMPGSGPIGSDEGSRTSWERTREICRWLDVADNTRGVAMATSHRWTRVDDNDTGSAVRCCLVRGGRMRPLDPAMDGPEPRVGLVFNFRFYPHKNSWQATRIPRTGLETVQPLLAYTVNDTWSPKTFPRRQSLATVATRSGKGDAILTCLKQAEDGKGVVTRWYESIGSSCQVHVVTAPLAGKPERVDLQEQPVPNAGKLSVAADGSIPALPWEITTVRMQPMTKPGIK